MKKLQMLECWALQERQLILCENLFEIKTNISYKFPQKNPLADLGDMPGARPPKGPGSFVLTYKIFET